MQEEGSFSSSKKERVLVIPYDHRLPKIRISTSLATQLRDHRLVGVVHNLVGVVA